MKKYLPSVGIVVALLIVGGLIFTGVSLARGERQGDLLGLGRGQEDVVGQTWPAQAYGGAGTGADPKVFRGVHGRTAEAGRGLGANGSRQGPGGENEGHVLPPAEAPLSEAEIEALYMALDDEYKALVTYE